MLVAFRELGVVRFGIRAAMLGTPGIAFAECIFGMAGSFISHLF